MAEFTEAEERFIDTATRIFELRVEHFDLDDRLEAAQQAGDEAAIALREADHPTVDRSEELMREAVRRTGNGPDSRLAQSVEDSLVQARELIDLMQRMELGDSIGQLDNGPVL